MLLPESITMASIVDTTFQEQVQEHLYGEATQNEDFRVLNESDTFAIFDSYGHINTNRPDIQGIYYAGTRYISRMITSIDQQAFVKLSSSIREKNDLLVVDLTNPTLENGNFIQGTVHVKRSVFVRNGACFSKFIFYNFGQENVTFKFDFKLEADFRDIFELRGMNRKRRGVVHDAENINNRLHLKYTGLDDVIRSTIVESLPAPDEINVDGIMHHIALDAGDTRQITINIHFTDNIGEASFSAYEEALSLMERDLQKESNLFAGVYTSNEQFTHWLNRSKTDLISLLAYTEHGIYPYAGVPWYNTAFGRDGIITAYETLWIAPEIAKNTLLFLSATQARTTDPARDAEPGKIFHEIRTGEMANMGEIPFDKYYGTIDATPLYLFLAGAYYERTGDRELCGAIWENIELALEWIPKYGDLDGDGFLEYKHKAENGLTNQGWKDSFDSISYESGELANEPIALVEVQAYVYGAYCKIARIARDFNKVDLAEELDQRALELKTKFNASFWDDELKCYVIALDAEKKPCRVVSSNAGHCLMTGIVPEKYKRPLISTLMNDAMFNGWGIRTLSSEAKRYNPMSYHNGSVWPHDVALIMDGMANCGHKEEALKLLGGLFDASMFIDLQRMPELFCGFPKRKGEGPTNYPVACSPQAWSVGAVFLMLKACLQIEIDAIKRTIKFHQTILPEYLQFVQLKNLCTPDGNVDLTITRYEQDIGVNVINKPINWSVIVEK